MAQREWGYKHGWKPNTNEVHNSINRELHDGDEGEFGFG